MNTATLIQSTAISTAAFVTIGGMRLVLPQSQIRALEAASDVDRQEPAPSSVGWIQYLQQRWPAYCLSSELTLLTKIPNERRACILLASGSDYVGVLCDEVRIARQNELEQQHELPSVMHLADTPILGLIGSNEDDVGCLTDAKQLVMHITRLVNT